MEDLVKSNLFSSISTIHFFAFHSLDRTQSLISPSFPAHQLKAAVFRLQVTQGNISVPTAQNLSNVTNQEVTTTILSSAKIL